MNVESFEHDVKSFLADDVNASIGLTPGDYGVSLETAIREFSGACPNKQKTKLATVADSMDISLSTLTDLVVVEGVEYPAGKWPRSLVPFETYGATLTMLLRSAPSAIEDAYVFWGGKHTAATVPVEHTALVTSGALGYALQILAMRKRNEALTKMGTASAEIAKMIAGGATNLAAAVTAISTAKTEIAKMITGGVGELSDADTALDSAKTEIAKMVTGGTYTHTDVKTAIDKMATFLESDANKSVLVLLDKMNDLIYHATNLPNASKYLTDNDDYLNAVTDGQNVASKGAEYAHATLRMADTWHGKANGVLSVVNGYGNQAIHELNVLGNYAREATQYMNEATGRLQVKGMYSKEASMYFSEATAHLNALTTYAREARAYMEVANAYTGIADRYQKQADQKIATFLVELQRVKANTPSLPRPIYHFAW